MAYDIGIVVGIDGEANVRKSLKSITTETKNYKAALKELESEFGATGSAEDKAAKKAEILGKQYDAQKRKVELLSKQLEELRADEKASADQINRVASEYNKAQAELNRVEQELKELQNQTIQTGKRLEELGTKMQAAGDRMMGIGRTLSMTVTVPLVALGAASVKAEADFSSAMSKVQALSGATTEEFAQLSAKAQEMGAKTVFSAKESADAFSYMALAGWNAKEMLDGIEPIMNLAAASGEDLATVSDIVTDDLTAFGLSAKDAARFTDVLAQTTASSNTNVTQMGEAFRYAAPLAGALGYSIDDIAVAVGLMANNGIKASMAGTTLRSLFTRMAKPTKESAQAMEDLGISMTDAAGQMLPLSDVLNQMRSSFSGLSEAEKASYSAMLGGQRAMSGLLAIVNSSEEDFQQLTSAIDGADGAAGRMAATMLNNTKGSLTLMKSALEGAGIAAGKALAPAITAAAKTIQNIANAFSKLSPRQQQFIVKMAGIAAATGPVLLIAGKLVKTVGSLTKGIGKLMQASTGMAGIAGKLVGFFAANPIAGFAVALAGVATAVIALTTHFNRLGETTQKALDDVRTNTEEVRSAIDALGSSFETASAEATGQAESARGLIDRLDELSSKSERTAAEQREMQDIVATLNASYPDMALAIDETTGALNKTTRQMREYVDQAEKVAKANAYAKQREEAFVELAKAEQGAAKAARDRRKAYDALTQAEQAVTQYEKEHADALKDSGDAGRAAAGELTKLKGEVTAARLATTEWDNAERDAKAAVTEAQEAVELATQGLQRNSAATAETAEQHRLLAAAEHQGVQAAQVAQEVWSGLSATQKADAQAIVDSVAGIEAACTTAIQSQMNMFEQFSGGAEKSTQELLDAMQSQVDGITQWEENLTILADRGINQGLLEKLAALGPQGANYVQAFVNASDEQLQKAGELWDQGLDIQGFENEEAEKLKNAFGTLAAGGEEGIQQLGEALHTAMDSSGKYTVDGLVQGIQNAMESVNAAMQTTAETAEEGYTSYMEQASPSRRMARDGLYTVQGLVQGMNQGRQLVASTARAIGQLGSLVGSTARSYVSSAYAAGRMLAEGLARGIRNGESSAINAAASMARQTLQAAKSTLGVASPSKEFYKIGDYSVQGYVNALADGARDVMMMSARTFSPAYAAAYYPSMVGGGGGSVTNNMGGMTVNVYGAAGQDVNALADAVSNRISREFIRRAAG